MKSLPIVWQRLVGSSGSTCPRCAGTQTEAQRAVERLKEALSPLGIEPVLETREIDSPTFKDQPTESNRIWIAGKPLEQWVDAKVGTSRCCAECGDSSCRTVEVEGTSYEVIPEKLLIRAGLIAASQLLDPTNQ